MNNTAIIDYDNNFSFLDEFLFSIGKISEKKLISSINIEDKIIRVIKFPASAKTLLNKNKLNSLLVKFDNFLKSRNIESIIISDEASKIFIIKEYLSKKFYIFNGKSVINANFDYILSKCLKLKKSDEVLIYSNNLDSFYGYLDCILNKFREISIITSYKNMFVSFTDEIFNNYGININIYNNNEYIVKENNFVINIDTDDEKNDFDLNFKKVKLFFIKNNLFDKVSYYFKEFDEKIVEFMIYSIYGTTEKSIITEFCDKYNTRIVKIYKK